MKDKLIEIWKQRVECIEKKYLERYPRHFSPNRIKFLSPNGTEYIIKLYFDEIHLLIDWDSLDLFEKESITNEEYDELSDLASTKLKTIKENIIADILNLK